MDRKLLFRSLIISGLASFAGVSAEQIDTCADWNPCCFDYGLNPPATCPSCSDCNWYGEISYLYWKPYIENAHAAEVVSTDRIVASSDQPNATLGGATRTENKDFKFDWDSGFRVGLGIGFPCDKWGIAVNWTHYRTDASYSDRGNSTITSDGNNTLITNAKIPLPGFYNDQSIRVGAITQQSSELDSDWDFQFNVVDLDLFRNYYVGCSLAIKPYVGLRALFLKSQIDSFAQYEGSSDEAFLGNLKIAQHLRSDFKGVGLKGGVDSFYELMCGLGIYGDIGAAVIYGNYDLKHRALTIAGPISDQDNQTYVAENELPFCYDTLRLMTDLKIGLEWRETFNCNQNMVIIKAGWEHHLLVNGSQFQTLESSGGTPGVPPPAKQTGGDLSLYGFVFSIGVSF